MMKNHAQRKEIAMKKMLVLLMLAVSVVSVTIPAWATVRTGFGDVVYEDPAPPK
jgi:hypothetical protein